MLNLEQQRPHAFDADDVLLAEAVCSQVGAALHRADLAAEVEATVTNTLGTLIDVLEAKDAYTAQHARDVVDLSERVARRLGLSDREVRDVHYAAILHDIGKIAVPSDILRKPSGLTDEEFEVIKTHSDVGGRLLERIPFTRSVARSCARSTSASTAAATPISSTGSASRSAPASLVPAMPLTRW